MLLLRAVAISLFVTVLIDCSPRTVPEHSSYDDLVALFEEWRDFQKPRLVDNVPDYTSESMRRQARDLNTYQQRLLAIDPDTWPIAHQVDYHIVRAEMNGLEFDHRVMRPWARMPSFYKVVLPSETDVPAREGQVMHGAIELWKYEPPLGTDKLEELEARIRAIPEILTQARINLVEDARDLWALGIRVKEGEGRALEIFADHTSEHHPGLTESVRVAREAVAEFQTWLETELPSRSGPSGIGVEEYNWHLQNVQLVPYTWDEQVTLIQRQLERAWGYLSIAENRNRNRAPLEKFATAEEYQQRYRQAVRDFVAFLDLEEVMTLSGYEEESLMAREGVFVPPDEQREFFTQVNYRDLRPMRAHGTHWFDLARMKAEPHPSPIRQVPLLYNIWASRAEGLATSFEEMMMEAGFLDEPQTRELVWVLLAQRAARALAELRMHSNEMTLDEAAKYIIANTPHNWITLDGNTVWREGQLYLEQPSYGTSYVIGKIHLDRLVSDRRREQGSDFSLRTFMDDLHSSGMIPLSLVRWEMSGFDDEMIQLQREVTGESESSSR